MFARFLRRLRPSSRSCRIPPRPAKPVRHRLSIEGLETRLAPACSWSGTVGPMTFNCDAAHDTSTMSMQGPLLHMTINGNANTYALSLITSITVNAGDGSDTVRVERTPSSRPVTINAGNHDDTVSVSPTAHNLANLFSNVTLNGGGGSDTVSLYDSSNPAAGGTYTLTSTTFTRTGAVTMTYGSFDGGLWVYGSPSNNTVVNVESTHAYVTRLNAGTGSNTVNVKRTGGALYVYGNNGSDTVNIGNAGSVQNIQAGVTVNNVGGFVRLNIDDSADPAARTWALGATALVGLAPATIDWAEDDLKSLSIKGARRPITSSSPIRRGTRPSRAP